MEDYCVVSVIDGEVVFYGDYWDCLNYVEEYDVFGTLYIEPYLD